MPDWIVYTSIALTSFAFGSIAKGLVANAERKLQKEHDELNRQEARRKYHKDFMDLVDTIEDYKIQVEAASIYLTNSPKAAYAFIIEQLQKTKG